MSAPCAHNYRGCCRQRAAALLAPGGPLAACCPARPRTGGAGGSAAAAGGSGPCCCNGRRAMGSGGSTIGGGRGCGAGVAAGSVSGSVMPTSVPRNPGSRRAHCIASAARRFAAFAATRRLHGITRDPPHSGNPTLPRAHTLPQLQLLVRLALLRCLRGLGGHDFARRADARLRTRHPFHLITAASAPLGNPQRTSSCDFVDSERDASIAALSAGSQASQLGTRGVRGCSSCMENQSARRTRQLPAVHARLLVRIPAPLRVSQRDRGSGTCRRTGLTLRCVGQNAGVNLRWPECRRPMRARTLVPSPRPSRGKHAPRAAA